MKNLTIIGDVHGKLAEYEEIIRSCEFSICVGDFGFEKEWKWFYQNRTAKHFINPGNHDWGQAVHQGGGSTGNFGYWSEYSLFTVRGAMSIDKHLRTEGIDWFANEELTYRQQLDAFDAYVAAKPGIVISHDCPQSVLESAFKMGWSFGSTQTRTMLQHMLEAHRPKLWVFGHHHQYLDVIIDGTRFVCLDELETLTVPLT